MADSEPIEWPREIWMAELDEHHNGTGMVVLSEHATIARWEVDTERYREFHRYVDADIFETVERYRQAKIEELRARIRELESALNRISADAAWTPKHPACEKILETAAAALRGDPT